MCKVVINSTDPQNLESIKFQMTEKGWVSEVTDDGLIMKHEKVKFRSQAKEELNKFGLLTSTLTVRIE